MKIAVTGANGFIGQHLARRLLDLGHSVVPLTRETGVPEHLDVDLIYHLATARGRDGFREVDLLAACCTALCPVVYASTVEAREPLSEYAAIKRAGEVYAMMVNVRGADVRVARLVNIYGPGQSPITVIERFVVAALHGQQLLANPNTTRDFLYVDDAVSALITLGEDRATGMFPRVDFGTGIETKMTDLAEAVVKICGSHSEVKEISTAIHVPEYYSSNPSLEVAMKYFRWSAATTLAEGLKKTVERHLSVRVK